MRASRRSVLKGAAAAAAVTAAGGVQAFPRRSAAAQAAGEPRAEGTTLDSTVVRGPRVNDQGYVRLASGPGEPHVVRDELGTTAQAGRQGRRRPVLSFVHLTDIHVIDAQSPARVEFTDRYDDDPRFATLFSSAYRPQEFLTPQYSDAIVSAVEQVGVGPVTGRPFDFAVCTGDNTDNAQLNELRWSIDVLDGTPLRPDSGSTDRFEGVADQDAATYDVHYWHPDGTPEGAAADDNLRRIHGFPTVPGLLDAARRPFTPTGLSFPWYTCYGNHDGLVQGNFPASLQLTLLAEGPLKLVGLPAGVSPDDLARALATQDPTIVQAVLTGPARQVTPDPQRTILTREQSVREHFTTGGTPLGHGFGTRNLEDGTAYYTFDPSPLVRGIVLDSVNPNGEASGSLDPGQFAWLREQLEAASGPGRDRLIAVFSHHTIGSMTNQLVFVDDPQPRVLGPEVRDLLLEFPNVVVWVNGHTHRNRITPWTREGGGGFWEVNTASHVDWPAQARLLELVDNRDGTLSIFGTILDADAPLSYGGRLDTPQALASLARELAANDPQKAGDGGAEDREGSVEDRNVEMLVAAPFPLQAAAPVATPPVQRPAPGPVPAREPLPATGGGGGGALLAGAAAVAGAAALVRRRADRPEPSA